MFSGIEFASNISTMTKLMLANQRFLAKHFDEALILYSELINEGLTTPQVIRRRLVCEIVSGSIEKAVKEALEILRNRPSELLNFIPSDDCPCQDLIQFITRNEVSEVGKLRCLLLSLYGCKNNIDQTYIQDLLNSQNSNYRKWTQDLHSILKDKICIEQ